MSETNKPKDGGLAFPSEFGAGMTLRHWFAGQALAGLLANHEAGKGRIELSEKVDSDLSRLATCSACYAMADQMIASSSNPTEDLLAALKEKGLI